MDSTKKRSLKKQIRIFLTISWSMIGFFLLYVLVIGFSGKLFGKPLADVLANLFGTAPKSPIVLIIAITLLVAPLFGGLMFTMLSQSTRQQLYSYMNGIRKYRSRKFCREILELLIMGKTKEAVNLYRVTNMYENNLDDYLYGIIITECRLCDDEELRKIGEVKTAKLLNSFDPAKINL